MEQITIKEIARMCGVGVSTVSRAINNHPDINPETKERIMETIRRYNYVPNNSARNLKRAESNAIAVMVKGVSNPFFGPVIQTMERTIVNKNYSFVLQQVEEDEDEVAMAAALEKEKRLKGIIFLGGMKQRPGESLKQMPVPCVISTVSIHLPEDVENCSIVSIDDEAESYRMTDYLIKCGHRRIVIMRTAEPDAGISDKRLAGYRKALQKHGIAYDPELVVPMHSDAVYYSIENGYEVTKELLTSDRDFTCIYAISDRMAIGAIRAVFDAGKRVPEDFSVAGFDGLDIARYYRPSVATIAQPSEKIADETIRQLFSMIEGKEKGRKVIFPARLLEGESVLKL